MEGNAEQWSENEGKNKLADVKIGNLSDRRRRQLCYTYITVESKSDERLWLESDDKYRLTLPNNLTALIKAKNGDYISYIDHEGICQYMTKPLAIEFDNYLVEITGLGSNYRIYN